MTFKFQDFPVSVHTLYNISLYQLRRKNGANLDAYWHKWAVAYVTHWRQSILDTDILNRWKNCQYTSNSRGLCPDHGTADRRLCHIVCVYNLLYIFLHELLVKVRPQSVVDEASFFLVAVATSTVLKHDVIIPPVHNALSCNQLGNRLLHATQSDTTMVEATRKKSQRPLTMPTHSPWPSSHSFTRVLVRQWVSE